MTSTGAPTFEAYARLAVEVGLNLQPGQDVLIIADVEHAELTRALMRQAFEAGARYVDVEYRDARLARIRTDLSPEESLGWSPPHRVQQIRDLAERGGAIVQISGPPNPANFEGVDGERLARNSEVEWRRAYLDAVNEGRFNWVVVAGPTRAWAERVFGEPDFDRLWRAIADTVRLEEPDPAAAWRDHVARLDQRADALNEHDFDAMHLRGPGTDLRIGLPEGAIWESASMETASGLIFVPNMPTEEIFTTPHAERVDGVVRSTKPLVLLGRLVREIEMRFEGGRAVEVRAAEGEDVLRESMATDENAARLGELALVDNDSRVGRTGITFYDTLFDENAASHIAYGDGLPDAIAGGRELSWEERERRGVNHSGVHVDFMIGGPELDVDGIKRDGTTVPVMRGGDFTLS